jgi:hypothetical protein
MKFIWHLNMRHMPHAFQLHELGPGDELLRGFAQLHKVAQQLGLLNANNIFFDGLMLWSQNTSLVTFFCVASVSVSHERIRC